MASRLTTSNRAGWTFALPGFSLIALFIILPFFFAFGLSLTNQRLVSPNPTQYVGLDNYRELLDLGVITLEPERDEAGALLRDDDGNLEYPRVREITRSDDYPQYSGMREWFRWHSGDIAKVVVASDVVFMKSVVNTLAFVVVVAPVQAAFALLLALLINQRLRGINLFRTIYFMPVVVSIVVVSLLWRFIYSGNDGLLNNLLGAMTFGAWQPIDWLGNTDTALGSIMAMSIWQAVGFHMVIWLAGLQTISPTLYEVAKIEGASKWQTFRYVTWPGLRNTAVLILIVITMQAFAVFAQIDVMTGGGPLDSTQTLVFQAVERGYGKQDISGGATISVILFLLVLSISLVQRYLTRERR
ncbi:carbohydrate ABC transporter permease [Bauldia litoralis]|uniref:Carbohydrate ABC transporter membrane protein 1, CUT1 family (TC 3.A.1.1.-) n=1 Tax=Bauldia litoralis TaxID=665467 RepID=A0A1G6BW19_9HYPH|nr:sugar ABC transporter permease [Bauldia litoralis]SDB24808.1 carbohydrate ABC transporter membrane protein 1, CUT1 family (TC 3.A.1.1.-) [Bauldia litoralis]